METFQNVLMKIGIFAGENKYPSSIKNAFQTFMPFIIKSASRGVVLLLCLLLPFASRLSAQVEQDVFTFSPKPEKDCKGKLMLQVDNLNFFQNNEFKTLTDGYSLPE